MSRVHHCFCTKENTLKVQIFAGTNFHRNLFLRELIFAIGPFKHFARTYFREFRESAIFLSFCEHKFSRFSRFSAISNILREEIFANFAEKTIFDILQERAIANFVRYIETHNFLGAH